jgi:hypothetical protein
MNSTPGSLPVRRPAVIDAISYNGQTAGYAAHFVWSDSFRSILKELDIVLERRAGTWLKVMGTDERRRSGLRHARSLGMGRG